MKNEMSRLIADKTNKSRAERSKSAILAAAENHFARIEFAATRLEDIADEVGLTRTALFYYFNDKQTLFDAMIADSFGAFASKLNDLLGSSRLTISKRIQLAAGAWVDAVMSRPNLALLILRFVADGIEQTSQRIFVENPQIPQKFFELFEEGCKTGELKPLHNDPFHFASAAIGTSVFYVAALATLVPTKQIGPLHLVQAAEHRRQALHLMRILLGIPSAEQIQQ